MMAPYVKSQPDDARISSHHTATIMAPDTMAAFDDNPEMHHGSESGSLHAAGCAKKPFICRKFCTFLSTRGTS
jgi:hypothetical protein